MICKQCLGLLSSYHDGVLAPEQRVLVRQHLSACPSCAARLADYERVDTQIASALTVTPRPGFRNAVLATTSHRQYPASAVTPGLGRRRGQILFGGLTGATVAALAILLVVVAAHVTAQHHSRSNLAARGGVHTHVASPTRGRLATLPFVPHVMTPRPALTPRPTATRPTVASVHLTPAVPALDRASLIHIAREALLTNGLVHSPLWSPDSSAVLYLSSWDFTCRGNWACGTLRRYAAGSTITIADNVRSFAWSPDGRDIVYAAQAPSASSLGEPQELRIVTADGSGSRLITGVDRTNVEWLPIGIVVARGGSMILIDPVTGSYSGLSDLPDLTVADDNSAFFALSQAGRFLAYQDGQGLRVWDRRRAGTLVLRQPLSKFGTSSFHFSWDGNTIFFSTYDKQYTKLYRQQLAPLGKAVALNDGLPLHGPINLVGPPSADNSVVSFRIGSGATARNYVIDAGHGRAHDLLPPTGVGPVGWWSPDGRHLVYIVYRGETARYTAIARVEQS